MRGGHCLTGQSRLDLAVIVIYLIAAWLLVAGMLALGYWVAWIGA